MDQTYFNIPTFALLRYGTVIVRLRMERLFSRCRASEARGPSAEGVPRVVRVAGCEQCTRTRIISKYSDCDSGSVGKCRRYRTRAAKSRYVNVCAAVCLLLLVGGLTPQSAAAPHRTRRMDKDKENETWANPCDYNKSYISPPLEYKPSHAAQVAAQARDTLSKALAYKDEVAELHSFDKFNEDLLSMWDYTKWLKNQSRFNMSADKQEYVLPANKKLNKNLEESELDKLMENVPEALPVISKTMKMVGASLRAISDALGTSSKSKTPKVQFFNTSNDVRHVLCLTSDLMRARGVTMLPLFDSEIPNYTDLGESEIFQDALIIYRDTINFLEYIVDFFERMSKENNEKNNA